MKSCIKKGGVWNDELNKCETIPSDSTAINTDYYWFTAYDSINNKLYLEKGRLLDSSSKSASSLIKALNERPANCKIEYIDLINDTLHIRIINDEFLTEQMGTTGAQCYLGETVYTLTENDSIKYVNIELNEGSHAQPGIFQRNDFELLENE